MIKSTRINFLFANLFILFLLMGCGPMIQTSNQIYTVSDYNTDRFFDEFQDNLGQYHGMSDEEMKELYSKRYSFANEQFRECSKIEGSLTDRGRIFIIYGPPDEISREPWVQERFGEVEYFLGEVSPFNNSYLKSFEIWSYDQPASHSIAQSFGYHFLGMTFVFGDLKGIGSYTLLYSTEDELSDSRINHY